MNLLKQRFLSAYIAFKSFSQRRKWKGKQRIFCLSLQKTGTTSFGDFFEKLGYPVVRSDIAQLRNWNRYWYFEEYHKIFNDPVFINHQVFEDAPFWANGFYKILQGTYPNAKFVLFTRDSTAWFNSLLAHGQGMVLGNKEFHAKNYEIPEALDSANFILSDHRTYYTQYYQQRNLEIIKYFDMVDTPFIHLSLEDEHKWQKLANFIGEKISEDLNIHVNTKADY